MRPGAWLTLAAAAVVSLLCSQWMVVCPAATACARHIGDEVGNAGLATPVLLVLAVALAWLGRTLFLLIASSVAVRRLPQRPLPTRLQAAIGRSGVADTRCLSVPEVKAFCTGVVRPRIYVSDGMVRRLRARELDAVLLHEDHHRRWREPLQRAMRTAAAEVLFFLPVVRWWADRHLEAAELAADRAVLRRLGPVPLAGALWAAGSSGPSLAQVAFDGAPRARAAQILGEPPRRTGLSLSAAVSSVSGLSIALAITACMVRLVPAPT